jgi:hypothetical protein
MNPYGSICKDRPYRAEQNVQVNKNRFDYVYQKQDGEKEFLQLWKEGRNEGRK